MNRCRRAAQPVGRLVFLGSVSVSALQQRDYGFKYLHAQVLTRQGMLRNSHCRKMRKAACRHVSVFGHAVPVHVERLMHH